MKVTLLVQQLGGTGGALAAIRIGNVLVREGHSVILYSEEGASRPIISLAKFPIYNVKVMSKHKPDATLCFNPREGSRIYTAFLELPGLKFWRAGLVDASLYEDVIYKKYVIKICTTSADKRYLDGMGASNTHVVIGPTYPEEYFPELDPDFRCANVVMSYLKKSGWVAVQAINMVQERKPNIVFACLGSEIPGSDHCIPSSTPIIHLGAPADKIEYVRYSYNKASVFVDSISNGWWAWPSTIAEAMLCKCPVVSSDSPEHRDILIDGETGFAVPTGEETELPPSSKQYSLWLTRPKARKLAERVIEILDNAPLREKMVSNAYKLCLKYNVDYWYNEFKRLL